jgi:5'-3' exonuclease
MSDTRPVLLVDLSNLFVRHYIVNPDMSSNGLQVGGLVGSLKTIRRLISDFSPKKVVIAWEGGGSTKRRAIYSEYKANRKPERLNRFYEDDIPDTADNRVWQMATLAKLLKHFPVTQVYVQDCEGDDVIAHLCRVQFKDDNKLILSNDRDFYQLLDEKTSIYSSQSKRIHSFEDVKKEFYGIAPRNFALAKALCGDNSDNIKGVRGLGFKTLVQRIPLLVADDRDITIDEVLDYCRVRSDEAKVMRETVKSEEQIRMNWRLVYLGGSTLDHRQEAKLNTILAEPPPKLDMLSFMRELIQVGIRSIENPHEFCTSFISLSRNQNRE